MFTSWGKELTAGWPLTPLNPVFFKLSIVDVFQSGLKYSQYSLHLYQFLLTTDSFYISQQILTVHHSISASEWLKPHLSDRSLSLLINLSVTLPYGVPQGSILRPFLLVFIDFLSALLKPFHLYAGDCHMYLRFKQNDPSGLCQDVLRISEQGWLSSFRFYINLFYIVGTF